MKEKWSDSCIEHYCDKDGADFVAEAVLWGWYVSGISCGANFVHMIRQVLSR